MIDRYEQQCPVCGCNYLTDGGEPTCNDPLCEALFELDASMSELLAQESKRIDAITGDLWAGQVGL